MDTLKEIYARASSRHGGEMALEAMLPKPKSRAALRRTPDHRYLAGMARAIFQAGFVWRIVEAKWDGFEAAFSGFEPARVARFSEQKLRDLAQDTRIIRNPPKIRAVRDNARWLVTLAKEHGSASRFFANWPADDIVSLWGVLKLDGSRMGAFSGPFFLRHMGVDTPMLTEDVSRALREQGVIDQKNPASKKALRAVQEAFNTWRSEGGRSLCEISRILACSVGAVHDPFGPP